jgi:hypothetical protein
MKAHVLICLALLPITASAIEPGPSSKYQAETERWMALQVDGRAASPTPQKATAAERDQALKRWLDYTYPIPEQFKAESAGTTKGGGG